MTEPSGEDGGELVRELRDARWHGSPFHSLAHEAADFIASAQSRLALSEAREAACVEALKPFAAVVAALHRTQELDRDAHISPWITVHFDGMGATGGHTLKPEHFEAAHKALSTLSPAAAGLLKIKEALQWFVDREGLIQAKFDLYGPTDTATAMRANFTVARQALAALTRTESR